MEKEKLGNKEIKKFIRLQDLEVYKLARELSKIGWAIYHNLTWQDKKVLGDQFIESTDSVGANIAEGYGRFHYMDKIKFYYNARASLSESNDHWVDLLNERDKVSKNNFQEYKAIAENLSKKINNFINSHYKAKEDQKLINLKTLIIFSFIISSFLISESVSAATIARPMHNSGLVGYLLVYGRGY
jgi:four helix bundle protein